MPQPLTRRAMLERTAWVSAGTAIPLWAGSATPGSLARKTHGRIRIGILGHRRGLFADRGRQEHRGAVSAIEDHNRRVGAPLRAVEYVSIDTQGCPRRAAASAAALASRGDVCFLVGGTDPDSVRAISAVAQAHRIVYAATAPSGVFEPVSGACTSFAFGGVVMDFIGPLVQDARVTAGKRWLSVTSRSSWAGEITAAARTAAGREGAEFLGDALVPVDTRNFGDLLSWIAAAAPDVVAVAVGGRDLKVLRQQIYDVALHRGPTWLFLRQDCCDSGPDGTHASFGLYAANWHPRLKVPGVAEFVDRFRARWPDGDGPDNASYTAYTAISEVLGAVDRAGTLDSRAVVRALAGRTISATQRMQHDDAEIDLETHVARQTTYLVLGAGGSEETIVPVARIAPLVDRETARRPSA
jgi:branched-chain amino acid transport system substrate-binding protein